MVVDPATGNVYVEDFFNWRVQEFTATGEFILMFGKEVNETTKGNICTAISKDKCKAGQRAAENSTELGAFDFEQDRGELLAVGGPNGLVYVGDKHRVQTFKTDGTPVGELSLASISSGPNDAVIALAVDQVGDVYVTYDVNTVQNVVYELDPSGKEIKSFGLLPRRPGATAVEVQIGAIAFDPAGRLAVTERERGTEEAHDFTALRGSLYEVGATSLHLLTEFTNEFPTEFSSTYSALSIVFTGEDHMYAVGAAEVISYVPVRVAVLSPKPAVCKPGADNEAGATFECDLKGEVNPWGVPETEAWFQWGKTPALGQRTGLQSLATGVVPVEVNALLADLRPNETYFYRLVGEDEHVKVPELLASEKTSLTTPAVAPRIVGAPSVLRAAPFSAVMFGELNPENANTRYEFQYGPCEKLEGCPGLLETAPLESPTYGVIGTTVEVSGLLPATSYYYRLLANSQGGEVTSNTGAFTTAPRPAVTAQTGTASSVGTTSAVVSGMVNPDGQTAGYTFELGRYKGADTQFGIVLSGPAGSGAAPIEESLGLSGLQPGTTYAYRIAIHSGDGSARGEAATGATLTFTTEGLSSVLSVSNPLALLAIPSIAFPKGPAAKVTPKKLTRAQQLARALKACEKKPKTKRAACRRSARKKYAVNKTKGQKK
jgi:hypothetical protein